MRVALGIANGIVLSLITGYTVFHWRFWLLIGWIVILLAVWSWTQRRGETNSGMRLMSDGPV